MIKDVILSISGLQLYDEENTPPVKTITSANYYKKHGKHYILYEEVTEGFDKVTKNILKVTDNSLNLQKKGVTNVEMLFERNKSNVSYYNTPYGSFCIGIHTKDMSITETQDDIDIEVSYSLDVNHEHAAECHIKINIHSKEAKNFKLL